MAQQIISIPWKTFKDKTPKLDKPLFIQVLGLCKSTTLEYFSAYVSSKTLEVIPLNGNKQPLTLDPERADTYLWAYMDEVFSVMLPDGSDDSKFGKQDYLPCLCEMLTKTLRNIEDRFGKLTEAEKHLFKDLDVLR